MKTIMNVIVVFLAIVLYNNIAWGQGIEIGLWGVPIDKLQDVYANGIRHVRVQYGTEGARNYANNLEFPGPDSNLHPLIKYIDIADSIGIKTVIIAPDMRLFFLVPYPVGYWGDLQPSIFNNILEMNELIEKLHDRYQHKNIKIVIYMDEIVEDSMKYVVAANGDTTFWNIGDLLAVVNAMRQKAHDADMEWWVASTTGPNLAWFHDQAYHPDRLLFTAYDIGFNYGAKCFSLDSWQEKKLWYEDEIDSSNYNGPASPIVAGHNFIHPDFGGTDSTYFPNINDMNNYIKLASEYIKLDVQYSNIIWVYVASNTPSGPTHWEPQYGLPPRIIDVYEAINQFRGSPVLLTEWEEKGNSIGGWVKNTTDKYFTGSFEQTPGVNSRFAITNGNGWAASFSYNFSSSGQLSGLWHNSGTGYLGYNDVWTIGFNDIYLPMMMNNYYSLFAKNQNGHAALLIETTSPLRWDLQWKSMNGMIGNYSMHPSDRLVTGDFVSQYPGDEILFVNPDPTQKRANLLRRYLPNGWISVWSNTTGNIGYFVPSFDAIYIAGDFVSQYPGKELLCINPVSGKAELYRFNGSWVRLWHNGSLKKINYWVLSAGDQFARGRFFGLNGDELIVMNHNTNWAAVMRYNNNSWQEIWNNLGTGYLNGFEITSDSKLLNMPHVKDRLMGINSERAVIMRFDLNSQQNYNISQFESGDKVSIEGIPSNYQLGNYPNPFNPITNIYFSIPSQTFVSIKIYDQLGREITSLISEELPEGIHVRQWDGSNLPSGPYFCRMRVGSFMKTSKIILLK
jgi:hypothetical protein